MSAIIELDPGQRHCLWPLFEGFPALRGVVAAVIDGGIGVARADNPTDPTVGSLTLHFDLVAGDPGSPHAVGLVHGLRGAIACDSEWEAVFHREFGADLVSFPRLAFAPGRWDLARLSSLAGSIPAGLSLERMRVEHVGAFSELDPDTVRNFGSAQRLIDDGFGFVVTKDREVIAGVATFAAGGERVEIQIDTHEAYRRLGLASALGARMILECLDRGLEPCWDGSNAESGGLAEKLGYVRAAEYRAWRFPASPA